MKDAGDMPGWLKSLRALMGMPVGLPRIERAGSGSAPQPLTTRLLKRFGGGTRPKVFEPALQHLRQAYRLGDPVFEDPAKQQAFFAARRRVMEHILRIVSESRWRGNLVLRGSILLKTWYPDKAREPGDLDWVVVPKERGMRDEESGQMLSELVHEACSRACGTIEIPEDEVESEDIWTYCRVPGRRVVLPWRLPGVAEDFVQMDFVFGERMATSPVDTEIRSSESGGVRLLTVNREQSLAWKLLWLASDFCPQGKDLYDAALLSEDSAMNVVLLERTFAAADEKVRWESWAAFAGALDVDWDNFLLEYPWIEGGRDFWREKLAGNLKRMLEGR